MTTKGIKSCVIFYYSSDLFFIMVLKMPHRMTSPQIVTDSTLFISEDALVRLRFLKEKEVKKEQQTDKNIFLRISVLSGGCYGFQYNFDFTSKVQKDDFIFKFEDVTIVTDEISYDLLKNVTLDYVQEMIGSAFTLRNPNSDASCGCGNSFSI